MRSMNRPLGENDGNETHGEEGVSLTLDLDPNQVIEADDGTLPYAEEEDWYDPAQSEKPRNTEPDLPFTMQTRQSNRVIPVKKYNPYENDFVVDRIYLEKLREEQVGLEEIIASKEVDIVDDQNNEWMKDQFNPEVEVDDELQ